MDVISRNYDLFDMGCAINAVDERNGRVLASMFEVKKLYNPRWHRIKADKNGVRYIVKSGRRYNMDDFLRDSWTD